MYARVIAIVGPVIGLPLIAAAVALCQAPRGEGSAVVRSVELAAAVGASNKTDAAKVASEDPNGAAAAESGKAKPPATVKKPYFGVAGTDTVPELRQQLGLAPGTGLTVLHVWPDSPAEKAGIERYDVLYKFDQHVLHTPAQIRRLIDASHKDQQVTLTVYRNARPQQLVVTMGETDVPLGGSDQPRVIAEAQIPAADRQIVSDYVDQLRRGTVSPATQEEALRRLRPLLVEGLRKTYGDGTGISFQGFGARYEDTDHELRLQDDGLGGRRLKAIEKSTGKVLFDGPIDTPSQRAAIPEALRPKLQRMETPPSAKTIALPVAS